MTEFNMRLHYGGRMHFLPRVKYIGGRTTLRVEDTDRMSWCELKGILDELGFGQPRKMWYVVPMHDMTSGLNDMDRDSEVCNMAKLGLDHGIIDVYAEAEPKEASGVEEIEEDDEQEAAIEYNLDDLECDDEPEWEIEAEEAGFDSEQDNDEFVDGIRLKMLQKEIEAEDCFETAGLQEVQVERTGEQQCHGSSEVQVERTDAEHGDDGGNSDDEVRTPVNSDDEEDRKGKIKMFNDKCPKENIKLEVGLGFMSKDHFKEVVADYAIFNGVNITWKRSNEQRAEAKCKAEGCKWVVHASWTQKKEAFIVKILQPVHSCSRAPRNNQASTKWLANHYLEKFRTNPNWDVSEMMDDVNLKFAIKVSKNVCYNARILAQKMIMGSLEEQYQLLPTYLEELKRVYRGSSFQLVLDRTNPTRPRFKRFYSCFQACRNGFVYGCRSIIGLDGCFLKTAMGGQLLSAVGRDGNNQMFPFAWAVVEGENEASWKWFLELLMEDLGSTDGGNYIVISDQQKGLENAVRTVMPHVEHRNCARHIYANCKKRHPGLQMKALFWRAVKSTNQQGCREALEQMKAIDASAEEDFTSIGMQKFCRAFISTFHKCDVVDNNISECFNNFILKSRSLPIVDMLESIRSSLMERLAEKRGLMVGSLDDICPRIRKKVEEAKFDCRFCMPSHAGQMKFQVAEGPNRFVVDIGKRSCSCGKWDVSGIPCTHSVSCIFWMKEDPETYVDELFKRSMYLKAYEQSILPMNGKGMWPKVDNQIVLPPVVKRAPGRPKKQRRRDPSENDPHVFTRRGLTVKCSKCQQHGHNKRNCQNQVPEMSSNPEVQKRKRGRPCKAKDPASTSGANQVPRRGRPPRVTRPVITSAGQGSNTTGQHPAGNVQSTSRNKLQIRRGPTTLEGQIHKEMAEARKGCGVLFSETTGMSYYVMPGQKMRTSYIGNYGGQFTQPATPNSGQSSTTIHTGSETSFPQEHHQSVGSQTSVPPPAEYSGSSQQSVMSRGPPIQSPARRSSRLARK